MVYQVNLLSILSQCVSYLRNWLLAVLGSPTMHTLMSPLRDVPSMVVFGTPPKSMSRMPRFTSSLPVTHTQTRFINSTLFSVLLLTHAIYILMLSVWKVIHSSSYVRFTFQNVNSLIPDIESKESSPMFKTRLLNTTSKRVKSFFLMHGIRKSLELTHCFQSKNQGLDSLRLNPHTKRFSFLSSSLYREINLII